MDDPSMISAQFDLTVERLLRGEQDEDSPILEAAWVHRLHKVGRITEQEMLGILQRNDGGPLDLDDPVAVAGEAAMIRLVTPADPLTPEQRARSRSMAKFAANAGRLKRGEITREEFEEIMGDDMKHVRWLK